MEAEMKYKYMGRSGLKVSVLGYGNMTTGLGMFKGMTGPVDPAVEQEHFLMMERCIKAGINFFDTAEFYGLGQSEEILGRNLRQGGWDRDELVLSTKLLPYSGGQQGNSRKRLRQGFAKSLTRLQQDYVDVIFLHRFDPFVPLKEQISPLVEFIENDQAFYWGTSVFTPAQLSECHLICEKHGWPAPIGEQCEYNVLMRDAFERDYAPVFDQYGTGTTIYSPLCGGILTGKYNAGRPTEARYSDPENRWTQMLYDAKVKRYRNEGRDILQGLATVAEELGCTQAQLALAWTLVNKDVTLALFGASNSKQLEDNLQALKVVERLDKDVLEKIEGILGNRPQPALNYRTFTPLPYRR
jgi:aryl-alcohol dehydrogenase-like predicted oxidoreductase